MGSVLKQIYTAVTKFFSLLMSGINFILKLLSLIPNLFGSIFGLFDRNNVFGLNLPSILWTLIPLLFSIVIIKFILRFIHA